MQNKSWVTCKPLQLWRINVCLPHIGISTTTICDNFLFKLPPTCSIRVSSIYSNSWTSLAWGGWTGVHCGFWRWGGSWCNSPHGDSGLDLPSNEHHQLQQQLLLCHCARLRLSTHLHYQRHCWGWSCGGLSYACSSCNNLRGYRGCCHGRG